MIIDFTYPNLRPEGWRVHVTKTMKDGRLFTQRNVFEDKDDAFEYYELVKAIWLKRQREKTC